MQKIRGQYVTTFCLSFCLWLGFFFFCPILCLLNCGFSSWLLTCRIPFVAAVAFVFFLCSKKTCFQSVLQKKKKKRKKKKKKKKKNTMTLYSVVSVHLTTNLAADAFTLISVGGDLVDFFFFLALKNTDLM